MTLTPTERIECNGEQFGKTETVSLNLSSHVKLLHTGRQVSARQLGTAMLAGGLASEQVGALALEQTITYTLQANSWR